MPWFVNWDNYKTQFEQEASRILGHPVHVKGSANASILPSPSLTFTDVQVGEAGGEPMMTVARFEATMELTPLLQGQIRVVSMKLDKPKVRVSVDENGIVDWLQRGASAQTVDPDKVALADVQVRDGAVFYSDARTGVSLTFEGITASVEARSLAGPWRAAGTYLDDGKAVQFGFATGRRLDDGTIRVKSDLTPSKWPAVISADGVLASDPEAGLSYAGTYTVTEVLEAKGEDAAADGATTPGWRSEGTFALTRDRLVLDKAILSNGPPEKPSSIAGSLTVNFGKEPSFDAVAEARQLDLDRSLGGGPTQPVNVASATQGFVDWLTKLPVPPIPGRIGFNVPAIVVGGSVIQDVKFAAEPAAAGWKVEGFSARLPGQASVSADGVLTTDRQVGFVGSARLAVAQPATFASWWRGGTAPGAGRLLSAFDIAGETEIAPGRVSVDKINARIGDATITGRFAWSEARQRRHLGTDLRADRIDFAQVKALADLLVGRDLTDTAGLADSFSIRLAAGAFQFDDVRMKDVTIDAAYAEDVLTVVQVAIGDLGGATFRVTSGRIDDLTTNPRGHLDARLEANTLDGLALIAGKLAPNSGLFQWMGHTATTLVPAFINARISAPPKGGDSGLSVALDGVAGQTTFNATVESVAKKLANWRSEPAKLSLVLDSPDSAALAQQFGLGAKPQKNDDGAHVEINGSGVPKDGLDTTVESDFAGLTTKAPGKLSFADGFQPSFNGTFTASADDLAPFIATAGLLIPGAAGGTPVALDGTIVASGGEATLAWQNGTIADRAVNGTVKFGRVAQQGWRLDGDLAVDSIDLGWLASLSLGFSPEPTGDQKAPWSKTPFSAPTYGQVSGKLTVATEHFSVGEGLEVANAKAVLNLQPRRIDVDLSAGDLAGGKATGGVSIQNVDGNASVTGQFNLTGASLESVIWQREQRAVATGVFDLSANFESTGRSPAGLLSSMTGGGVVAIRDGVARYINPATARSIVRLSDIGEQYSDETLKAAVEKQIDADSLTIGETGGAFSIAAGTVRFTGLAARGGNVEADGNAVIDLNEMTLDSDWTLTFDAGDTKVDGAQPKLGLVFRGPLAAPTRMIDALQLGSYLNTRQAARMLEIIASEEADRIERDRFAQIIRKLQDDRDRAERERQQAIDLADRQRATAIVATAKIARLHIEREILDDDRRVSAIVRSAELSAGARDAAGEVAKAAAARAGETRDAATKAAAALPAAIAADESAAAAAATAAANFATAQSAASVAADAAARQVAKADAVEKDAIAALDAERAARAAATQAGNDATAANLALEAANAKASVTKLAAEAAVGEEANAQTALDAADKALAEAVKSRDTTAATLTVTESAFAEAQKVADEASSGAASAAQQATTADAERAKLEITARSAATASKTSGSARDDLRVALDLAIETDARAKADVLETAGATPVQLAGKKAAADHAKAALEIARADFERADTEAAAAADASSQARVAAEDATQRAVASKAVADEAAARATAAAADLSQKADERATAKQVANSTQMAAERAAATFSDAQTNRRTAEDRVAEAAAAAKAASAEQQTAAYQSAASTAGGAAFALNQASATRATAVANAVTERTKADELKAVAESAAATLVEATTAYNAARIASDEANAKRVAMEAAAADAAAAVDQAEADAAAATADAKTKAEDAEAAAARAGLSAVNAKGKPPAVPLPRQRQKPKIASDSVAGERPLVITP